MLFRKIEKSRWNWGDKKLAWLKNEEIPAAPLSDFRASPTSQISVWKIEDNKTNLERIVAAIAARLQHLDKFDYVMFSENMVEGVGIQIRKSSGQSADPDADKQWHLDLVEISATKLISLTQLIDKDGLMDRRDEQEVEKLIRNGVNEGRIEKKRINKDLRSSLFKE